MQALIAQYVGRTFVDPLDLCVVVTNSCNVEEATGSANDSVVSPVNSKGKNGFTCRYFRQLL